MQMTDFGLIPKAYGGSESTYYTDFSYLYGGTYYGLCGSFYEAGGYVGLSCLYLHITVPGTHPAIGASLSYK